MSSRVGPIVVAIAAAAARITGEHGAADVLAMCAVSALTFTLHRASAFRAAAPAPVRAYNLIPPSQSDDAYPIAH